MCIFSQPVEDVNSTQIFARLTQRGTQYIVYQMSYESRAENAMILPVPIRQPVREDSLRFIDLKEYEGFFADLVKGFPFCPPFVLIGCSGHPKTAAMAPLKVFEVGNYIASFVPSLTDFERLDPRFRLPQQTWSQLPGYKNFGFAVFQLAAGALKPHPMAFEFETANKSIYFPTLHIHDGEIHESEEFDHVLYLQHAGFDSRVYAYENPNVRDKATGLIRSQKVAKKFCNIGKAKGVLDANLLVHRMFIQGNQWNRDTEVATFGDPVRPTLNFRSLWSYTPWMVPAGAVIWFFRRRAKIRAKQSDGGNTVSG